MENTIQNCAELARPCRCGSHAVMMINHNKATAMCRGCASQLSEDILNALDEDKTPHCCECNRELVDGVCQWCDG